MVSKGILQLIKFFEYYLLTRQFTNLIYQELRRNISGRYWFEKINRRKKTQQTCKNLTFTHTRNCIDHWLDPLYYI